MFKDGGFPTPGLNDLRVVVKLVHMRREKAELAEGADAQAGAAGQSSYQLFLAA